MCGWCRVSSNKILVVIRRVSLKYVVYLLFSVNKVKLREMTCFSDYLSCVWDDG